MFHRTECLRTTYRISDVWPATSTACRRNQQAAQELLEKSGGEVVFEGDPASVSDVDSVAQAMLAAMGVPEVHMLPTFLHARSSISTTIASNSYMNIASGTG